MPRTPWHFGAARPTYLALHFSDATRARLFRSIEAATGTVGYATGNTEEERDANAWLQAAAPDLLQVAQGALGYLEALPVGGGRPDEVWLKPLRAAIAKAKGNPPPPKVPLLEAAKFALDRLSERIEVGNAGPAEEEAFDLLYTAIRAPEPPVQVCTRCRLDTCLDCPDRFQHATGKDAPAGKGG